MLVSASPAVKLLLLSHVPVRVAGDVDAFDLGLQERSDHVVRVLVGGKGLCGFNDIFDGLDGV